MGPLRQKPQAAGMRRAPSAEPWWIPVLPRSGRVAGVRLTPIRAPRANMKAA
jgi:hypothetical protein